MAKMIPEKPRKYDSKSGEDKIFYTLKELPDDYIVIHSFNPLYFDQERLYEKEIDFVVFHPQKGMLLIEVKNGKIAYDPEKGWITSKGDTIGSPQDQINKAVYAMMNIMKEKGLDDIVKKCKIMPALCFLSYNSAQISKATFPENVRKELVLSSDKLLNIKDSIEDMFDIQIGSRVKTRLSDEDVNKLLQNIIAPSFKGVPLPTSIIELNNAVFNSWQKEQLRLLDYLEEQKVAAINGLGGTGKTMIAIEKAKRNSDDGEKVLFLCFNKRLKDFLKNNYCYDNVDYFTIDGFAIELVGKLDYGELKERLIEYNLEENFPYQHIIIDECQDFGQEGIRDSKIVEELFDIVEEKEGATLYIFYDKTQFIQGKVQDGGEITGDIPDYIKDADCKLTLYRNCRNTENIAYTSVRPLSDAQKPKMLEGYTIGDKAKLYVGVDANEAKDMLDMAIKDFVAQLGIEDITIISLVGNPKENSILKDVFMGSDRIYKYGKKKIPVVTSREFKGLESDAVIVIDVFKSTFENEVYAKTFYVASSRAKFELSIVAAISEADCLVAAEKIRGTQLSNASQRKPLNALATELNANLVLK